MSILAEVAFSQFKNQICYPENVMFVEIKIIALEVSKTWQNVFRMINTVISNQTVQNETGRPQRLKK